MLGEAPRHGECHYRGAGSHHGAEVCLFLTATFAATFECTAATPTDLASTLATITIAAVAIAAITIAATALAATAIAATASAATASAATAIAATAVAVNVFAIASLSRRLEYH